MAKITTDHTASGIPNDTSGHRGAYKGYEEHWQRVLEQAHLEKQVSAMRSTRSYRMQAAGFCRTDVSMEAIDAALPSNVPSESVSSAVLAEGYVAIDGNGARPGYGAPPLGICPTSPLRPLSAAEGLFSIIQKPSGPGRSMAVTAASPMDVQGIQRMLPPSSLVTIMTSEEGIHVVIRDTTVEVGDVKRLIAKIRTFLDAQNRRLFAVTLNGRHIWMHPSVQPMELQEDETLNDREMDKCY